MKTQQWPTLPQLPELTMLFKQLEQFVNNKRHWNISEQKSEHSKTIQQQVNNMNLYVRCEKMYGWEFWQRDPRRIQASVVHLFIYLKMLLHILVIDGHPHLLAVKQQQQLLISMNSLEVRSSQFKKFMNKVVVCLQTIYCFMMDPLFQEEQALTIQFFQQFQHFLSNLPTIHKQTLMKTPKLMEFICVNNPLSLSQYCNAQQITASQTLKKRKGSINDTSKIQINRKQQHRDTQHLMPKNHSNQTSPEKTKSNINESLTNNNNNDSFTTMKQSKHFHFHDSRKPTAYTNVKKPTVTTRQDKSPSFEKELNQSWLTTMQPKRQQMFYSVTRSVHRRSMDHRRREVTQRTIHVHSPRKSKHCLPFQHEDIEREREDKESKTDVGSLRFNRISELTNLQTGISKGWGVAREKLNQKLAQKLINKLIFQ